MCVLHHEFDYSFFVKVNLQVVIVWELISGNAVAEKRFGVCLICEGFCCCCFWFFVGIFGGFVCLFGSFGFFWRGGVWGLLVWFLVFFGASSQTILICCCSRLLDHAAGSMGCYYGQTAPSAKPQQLNWNAPSWPGVLFTPARCWWPGGSWKWAQAGLDFGLWMRKVPPEMDLFVCWEQPPPLGVVRTERILTRDEYCWLFMTHMEGKEHKSLKEDRNVTREHKLLCTVLRVASSVTCLIAKFWGCT